MPLTIWNFVVIDLTMDGNQVGIQPPMFVIRCVKICYCFLYQVHVANTCYPQKKLISNTDCKILMFGSHFILAILAEKKKIVKSKCCQFKLMILRIQLPVS